MMKIKMTMKMKMNDAEDMKDVETVKEKEKQILGLMSLRTKVRVCRTTKGCTTEANTSGKAPDTKRRAARPYP